MKRPSATVVKAGLWLAENGGPVRVVAGRYGLPIRTVVSHWYRHHGKHLPNVQTRAALKQTLLNCFGRSLRSAQDAFDTVRDYWGSVDQRKLWRMIAELESSGDIERVGTKHSAEGYVRRRR